MVLSPKAVKYLVKAIKIARFFGSIPYAWNEKRKRVEFVDTKQAKIIWYIHNTAYCAYLLFVLCRWVQVALIQGPATSPVALGTLYVFTAYNVVVAIQLSLFFNYGQHQMWINNFLELREEYQKMKAHPSRKIYREAESYKTMRGFMIAGCTIFCLDTLSVFSMPHAPFFVTSLLPDPLSMSALQLLPVVSIHLYIWCHQWATIFFYVNVILAYLTGFKNVLSKLKCTQTSHKSQLEIDDHNSCSSSPQLFSEEFRKLQIMQCFCNKIWSTTNALYEVVFIGGSILGFYGSVRLGGARAVQQFVAATFITSALLNLLKNMGDIFEMSTHILDSWQGMRTILWFRRFLKSTRPARMNIGGFFYADSEIRLTVLAIIFDKTTNLLLSTS